MSVGKTPPLLIALSTLFKGQSKPPATPSGPVAPSRAPVVSVLVRPGTLDVGTRFGLLPDSQVNFTGRPGIFFPKDIALDPKDGFRFAIEARSWGGLLKVVGAFGSSIVSEKERVHSGFQSITDASLTLEFLPDSTGVPILRLSISLPHNLLATPLDLTHDFPPSSSLKFPHQRFSLPFHPVLPFALGSVAASLVGMRMSADVAGSSTPGPLV
ncbi:hypothetical protein RQP46_003434 [Phenoliferia psychrophenolica]